MMKNRRLLIALMWGIGFSVQSFAEIDQTCDQLIIDSLELNASEDFFSYLSFLYESKIITLESLQQFVASLKTNKLLNPVSHEKSSFGPIFKSSHHHLHYFQIQNYLEKQKKDPTYLNLIYIKDKIQKKMLASIEGANEQLNILIETQLDFILDNILDENKSKILLLANMISKKYPRFEKKIIEISSSKDGLTEEVLTEMSNSNPDFKKRYLESIFNSPPGSLYLPDYFQDDGSTLFYSFVLNAVDSDIPSGVKLNILERVRSFDANKSLENRMLKILENLKSYDGMKLVNEAVRIIGINQSDERTQFLINLLKSENSVNYLAKIPAAIELMKRGELSFLKNNLAGLGKVTTFSKASILKSLLTYALGKSDKQLLELIKVGLNFPDKEVVELSIEALNGRTDEQSLNLLKNILFFQIHDDDVKLRAIKGNEERPWMLKFISMKLRTNDELLYTRAIEALVGKSSIESRNYIEEQYFVIKEDWKKYLLSMSLKDRPMQDLVYFAEKYLCNSDPTLVERALEYANKQENIKLAKIAKEIVLEDILSATSPVRKKLVEQAFQYMTSIPSSGHLDFWKEVSSKTLISRHASMAKEKIQEYDFNKSINNYFFLVEQALNGNNQAMVELDRVDIRKLIFTANSI